MNWFTSDQHYGHRNIITYCGRPFVTPDGQPDLEAMHRVLVERWNDRVGKDDDVDVLGDFSFGRIDVVAARLQVLKGRKHLVKGNHDRHSNAAFLAAGFSTVQKCLWLTKDILLIHRPQDWIRHGDPFRPPIVLSGHHHERYKTMRAQDGALYVNVGVDVRGFAPVTLEDLGLTPGR
jgi:calcineurin-like phosphoesterase family protein